MPMPLRLPVCLCLLLGGTILYLVSPARAAAVTESDWSVRVWQADEGLSNNNVTGVAQTTDGYLWISTRTKLARFDGLQIEEYPSQLFLPDPSKGFRVVLRSRQ